MLQILYPSIIIFLFLICRDMADEITSSFIAETTTFRMIFLKVSPTPVDLKPGFLPKGICRHVSKASVLVGGAFL